MKKAKVWHFCNVSFLNHWALVNLKNNKPKPEKSLFFSKPLLLLGENASGAAALRDCSTGLGFGGGALKINGAELFVNACT